MSPSWKEEGEKGVIVGKFRLVQRVIYFLLFLFTFFSEKYKRFIQKFKFTHELQKRKKL